MILELEWRIPWPAEWPAEKKAAAADRLADYINTGTMFEVGHRMQAQASAIYNRTADNEVSETVSPYLRIRLER